jgi:hypothetical protein
MDDDWHGRLLENVEFDRRRPCARRQRACIVRYSPWQQASHLDTAELVAYMRDFNMTPHM